MPIIQPRFIRWRDAPDYLGMCKSLFGAEVRPYLVEIPIGRRGVAFDRLDLDAWADRHKADNGRPTKNRLSSWEAQGASPAKTTVHRASTKDGKGNNSPPGLEKARKNGRSNDSSQKSPSAKGKRKRETVDEVIAMCMHMAEGSIAKK